MKGLLCLSVLLLLWGCGHHPGSPETGSRFPGDSLISRELMVKITADVHVVEAGLQNRRNKQKDIRTLAGHFYHELFSKYRISELRYRQNIGQLQKDPKDFMAFYDEVIKELDARIGAAQKAVNVSIGKR